MVVRWSSLLWQHKKLGKHKKKKEKIRKTTYLVNSEKYNESIFLLFSKKWFLRTRKTQKTKTHLFPQTSFLCVLFSRIENNFWKQEPNKPLLFIKVSVLHFERFLFHATNFLWNFSSTTSRLSLFCEGLPKASLLWKLLSTNFWLIHHL